MSSNSNRTLANKTRNTVSSGYRSSRNAVVGAYESFGGMSTLAKVMIIIVVIVLVVLLIMWIKNLYEEAQYKSRQSPFIVTKPINAFNKSSSPLRTKVVPYPVDGLNFTYSLWIYVADWSYNFGKWKNIFVKGVGNVGQVGTRSPGMWLYPTKNSLHIRMDTFSENNTGCDIDNIPLQKWVHIGYVLNNRNVDVYIDGKLERSCVLNGIPKLNNDPILVVENDSTDGGLGGFYGQIAKMQYFTRALMPTEVAEIYSEGPMMQKQFRLFSDNGDTDQNGCGEKNISNE